MACPVMLIKRARLLASTSSPQLFGALRRTILVANIALAVATMSLPAAAEEPAFPGQALTCCVPGAGCAAAKDAEECRELRKAPLARRATARAAVRPTKPSDATRQQVCGDFTPALKDQRSILVYVERCELLAARGQFACRLRDVAGCGPLMLAPSWMDASWPQFSASGDAHSLAFEDPVEGALMWVVFQGTNVVRSGTAEDSSCSR